MKKLVDSLIAELDSFKSREAGWGDDADNKKICPLAVDFAKEILKDKCYECRVEADGESGGVGIWVIGYDATIHILVAPGGRKKTTTIIENVPYCKVTMELREGEATDE